MSGWWWRCWAGKQTPLTKHYSNSSHWGLGCGRSRGSGVVSLLPCVSPSLSHTHGWRYSSEKTKQLLLEPSRSLSNPSLDTTRMCPSRFRNVSSLMPNTTQHFQNFSVDWQCVVFIPSLLHFSLTHWRVFMIWGKYEWNQGREFSWCGNAGLSGAEQWPSGAEMEVWVHPGDTGLCVQLCV